MPIVFSDKDLPKSLDTPTKQVKWAKKLVTEHLGSAAKRVDKPPMQGMFSRTLFVTLADAREVVIQFRTEPLDISAFKIAKGALGSFVPDTRALDDTELKSEGAWAYSFARMPGKMWYQGVAGRGAEGRIAVNKSLGRVFSKGCLANNSSEAVRNKIQAHLDAILASPLEEILPYKVTLEGFVNNLDELAKLPLWIAHYDLNDVNVLIDENYDVTALIDWELSTPLPFGTGFGRIHTLAGEYSGGEFWMPDEFEVAERGFWKELFDGMPENIRKMLEKRINLVQDAVILGTLLDCFFFDNGKVGFSQIVLKALPKFLAYRIPFIRGHDQPYRE
ncbi:hypothetical protein BDY21DRAFT_389577 [Lineolata rhizophorae]|uniref:Aminoglycoside phosphotransferase domain-containing protein n=1 Tax=Lineolata rhizophorae TaxID=578093 RepID=A0A6A6PFK7_9PEZI|nr:hypothetical protein BDY21DRAFT_389577 [Lineolata rhizophorae]